jgi:hypothetical protein
MIEFKIPKKIYNKDVWDAVETTISTFSDYIVKNIDDISEFREYLKKLDNEKISQNRNNSIGDYLKYVYFRNLLSIYNMVADRDFLTNIITLENATAPTNYVGRNISLDFIDLLAKSTNVVDRNEKYTFLHFIKTLIKAENFVKNIFTALYKNYLDIIYYEFNQKNPDAEKDKDNYDSMFLKFIKEYIDKDEMFGKIYKDIAGMLCLMCIVILLEEDIKKYHNKDNKKGGDNNGNDKDENNKKDKKDNSSNDNLPVDSTKSKDMLVIINTKNYIN